MYAELHFSCPDTEETVITAEETKQHEKEPAASIEDLKGSFA